MTPKKIIILILFLLAGTGQLYAQIYAQGHNVNKMNVYNISVMLEKQPEGSYLASLDFRGQRKEVNWYIKEGAIHKAFTDEQEMISYLQKNGWIFMQKENVVSYSGEIRGEQYLFRKSMEDISTSYEEEKKEPE